jgi:(E)-4-hydroxy-3-methylbut-2-enyl-diphosphate synthase
MWEDRLSFADLDDAVKRIDTLARMGCGLLRFAVPDLADAEILGSLAGMVSTPLVADIHFDYKIALRAMDFPIAKIRINPGNIGSKEKVLAVLEKAADKNIPIRIGVNAGSLPMDLRQKEDRAEALVEAAMRELAIFDEFGFNNVLVSMKASGIADTIRANRILAGKTSVPGLLRSPLHIGLTEAGPLIAGVARSSVALAMLLAEGIGDTIRVSLSDSIENEVIAAREICGAASELANLYGNTMAAGRLRQGGVTIISCPRCGRHGFDTHGFCSRWLHRLYAWSPTEPLNKKLTIAIMGCEVNGPEEARHADLGITGSGNRVLIFRHGVVVKTVSTAEADEAFAKELEDV